MKKTILALAALTLIAGIAPVQAGEEAKKDDGEWIQLFNGKDLTGWIHLAAVRKPCEFRKVELKKLPD